MAGKFSKPEDLTAQELEMVQNWHLPDVKDDSIKPDGKTSAMGRSVDWYYGKKQREQEQAEQQEEEIKPLTAVEIEDIRQAAYDEGILQGHNDGFEKGHSEGLEKGHSEGLEKGKEEGIAAGMEEGRVIIIDHAERWQQLTEQLNNPLFEINETVEKQLLELTVQLAEAVIGVEVKTSQTAIFNTLKESIDALPVSDSRCEISLNPADLELVKNQFSDQNLADKGWHIKAEPTIEQGGCIVESRTSSIDRTLKERIKSTLDRFLHDTGVTS
jgi:flagellar assembly protein FliH